MSEFIGARISLISKSDIRYVGTLHEINSKNSTVALEQVTSFGTEGRKGNPEEEIAGTDNVYEYIVFRGSDVKDLRIEEPPNENKPPPPPPQVPNDPAILGTGSRPQSSAKPPQQNPSIRGPQPPFYPQQPQFPYQYPPYPPQRFSGPNGPPVGFHGGPQGGFPGYGMPYGGPPGWYSGPAPGFPGHGPFPSQHQMPAALPGSHMQHQQAPRPFQNQTNFQDQQQAQDHGSQAHLETPPAEQKIPSQQPANQTQGSLSDKREVEAGVHPAAPPKAPTPSELSQNKDAPELPNDSKPHVAEALASPISKTQAAGPPSGPKAGRIVPAIPKSSQQTKGAQPPKNPLQANAGNASLGTAPAPGKAAAEAAAQYQSATEAATAAVAAAMAKLPPVGKPKEAVRPGVSGTDSVENLAKKVAEMRTDDRNRHGSQIARGGPAAGYRGSARGNRGGRRGSGQTSQGKGVEVPTEDFDFESANAKFNKQNLVKEAIVSGSPLGSPAENGTSHDVGDSQPVHGNGTVADDKDVPDVVIPAPAQGYNKSSSFFDNISSEARDREEAAAAGSGAASGRGRGRGGGFRNEERKRNMETFGLGSVDGLGFGRGGYRGRGRGGRYGGGVGGGYRGLRRAGFRGRGISATEGGNDA